MGTSKHLTRRERVHFAVRHWPPTERMIDLIMERMPAEVILTGKGQPDKRTKVDDLNPREFGKLVRQIVGEMQRSNVEY